MQFLSFILFASLVDVTLSLGIALPAGLQTTINENILIGGRTIPKRPILHTPFKTAVRDTVLEERITIFKSNLMKKILPGPRSSSKEKLIEKEIVLPPSRLRANKKSISTDFDPEFQKQGEIGSCHVFATTELVRAATGFKVSKARLFLDHLMSVEMNGPDGAKGIMDRNVEFVNENRALNAVPESCKNMPGWEWGRLFDNLELLQTVGGIVVPTNSDWSEIERVMEKIGKERIAQVADASIIGEAQRTRLGEAGLNEIIERALAAEHGSQIGNREMIMEATHKLFISRVPLEYSENLFIKTTILARALERGPIYLGVDGEIFYKAAFGGVLDPEIGVTQHANHAVCLVGYRVIDDKFMIKDSNLGKLLMIKAQDLVLATGVGFQLEK